MQNLKISAVVVTYNRKELLLECVSSLMSQSYRLDTIIIIDNNSTDGTYEALDNAGLISNKQIKYKKLDKNMGGAGGFYEGMKLARELNSDWVWIMDDDTIPLNNSLEELVKALDIIEGKVSFLSSSVYGTEKQCMNVPIVNTELSESGAPDWYKYLKKGIIKINQSTFVSLLVNGQALKECGLPCKDYFIWGDDSEYTWRLNKYFGNAYMIGSSEVVHKRKSGKEEFIKDEEEKNKINRYFYRTRNEYLNLKTYKRKRDVIKFYCRIHINVLKLLFSNTKYKWIKIITLLKGLYAGIFKRYDYKAFENRLKS